MNTSININDNNSDNNDLILLTTEDAAVLEDYDDDDMPPLTKASIDNILLANKLSPDNVKLKNFNIAGPATKRGLVDSKIWNEIVDLDGSIFYMRKGFYRIVSSGPPAPRNGFDWYQIGGKFYVVNKVNIK